MTKKVTFKFNKLIRDQAADFMKQRGDHVEGYYLSGDELAQALKNKLCEEAQEVATAHNATELLKEIGDVYDVLEQLLAVCQIDQDALLQHRQNKKAEKGGFESGFFCTQVKTDQNSWTYQYCLQDSRYVIAEEE